MKFERCANSDCRRPFQVNEFDFGGTSSRSPQLTEYNCPHCGHIHILFGSSTVLVHALSAEQEAEFNRVYPLPEPKNKSSPHR